MRGPFKRWHHAHHFEPDGRGGTLMRDVIDRYLRRLIGVRNEHVKAIAEARW